MGCGALLTPGPRLVIAIGGRKLCQCGRAIGRGEWERSAGQSRVAGRRLPPNRAFRPLRAGTFGNLESVDTAGRRQMPNPNYTGEPGSLQKRPSRCFKAHAVLAAATAATFTVELSIAPCLSETNAAADSCPTKCDRTTTERTTIRRFESPAKEDPRGRRHRGLATPRGQAIGSSGEYPTCCLRVIPRWRWLSSARWRWSPRWAALHFWTGALASVLNAEDVAALNLGAERNLSRWFSSTVLGASFAVALTIYSVRRHRVDDYHGRYRVWIWIAVGCLIASLGETTDLGRLAAAACRAAAGLCGLDGQRAWPIVECGLLAALAIRLLIEVRKCRLAVIAWVLAAVCFLMPVAVDRGWLVVDAPATALVVTRCSCLAGYVFVLFMFLTVARQLGREINGLVAAPRPARRSKMKATTVETSEPVAEDQARKPALHVRTDLDPVERPAATEPAARVQMRGAPGSAATESREHVAGGGNPALSRAERRKMRRMAS